MTRRKVVKWTDGDSGRFKDGTRFRLAGYNAPERHQFGGEKATRRAAGMTGRFDGSVSWKPVARDAYGRELGHMRNRDGSINKRLKSKRKR